MFLSLTKKKYTDNMVSPYMYEYTYGHREYSLKIKNG